MGHIFVSYSRGDIAFAERLEEALRAEGREIWRDKKDMMPAADWAQEISRAIVGADTVIFVISPSSIVSQSCAMELAQSVENRKRIIPVVCADVDPKTDPVPDAVARLDWIFLRPSDDFASGMRRLALGLDTDLDYWHRGAEIAERARQWKARASDRSLLLRGKDLEDAQGWLLLGASRVPSPSPFQADFIDTSRRANTQRQRQTVAGLSGVSVVLLLLTLVAGVFAKVANDRGQLALSHQLSGQSNTVRLEQNRPNLALLYGIQGVQLNDNANTRDSLAAALTNEPHLSALLETTEAAASPAHAVTAVAYSRDGSAAYASTIDGTILRWDMKTLQRTEYHTPSHSGPAYISRMDIGPDGKSLAYIDGGGLWLWNQITSGGKAQLLFDFTKLVTDKRTPALSFQNSLALAYTTRGSIEVVIAPGCNDSSPIAGVIAWNAATAKLSAAYSLPVPATLCPAGPYNIVDVAAIRPDGLRVAISCNNAATAAKPTCPSRQIQLWDLSDPKNAVQLVNALADTTHGPDPTKPANPAPPPNPYIPIGKLVYADGPQGLRVVGTCPIVGSCSFARFWDFALSAYPSVLSTGTVTNDASFDNLGNHLALGGCANVIDCSSGSLQLWDVTTPTPTRPTPARLTEPFGKHINLLARVALSPDGKRVLTQQFNDNALAVWDLDTVDPITERVSHTDFTVPTVPASPTDPTSVPALSAFWYQAALSPDGATLAELVYAGTTAPNVNTISLRLTRVSDQSVIKSVPLAADTQVVGLSFSADGSRLVAVMPSHIAAWKWDGHTLSTLPKIGAGVGAGTVYQGFSMSADGKLVAVTHNPDPHLAIPKDAAGQIELWDTDTGKMRGSPLKKEKSIPYQVALSPDGGSVATAYYPDTVVNPSAIDFTAYFDHAVSVWDVAGQHRHDNVYSGHDTAPAGLIYSPDGRHLSSIDLYGRVIVWDTQTKQAVSKINAFDRQDAKLGVNASFSPDGRYVVFSGGEFDAQSGGFGAAHDVITILDIAQNQKYVQPITNLIPGSLRIPLVVNVQVDAGARHLYYTVTRDTIGETYVRDLDPSAWIARACQVAAHPALTQSDWSVLVGQGQPPAACMG